MSASLVREQATQRPEPNAVRRRYERIAWLTTSTTPNERSIRRSRQMPSRLTPTLERPTFYPPTIRLLRNRASALPSRV